MCHPWCRTRIHFHPFACTWAFHLPSLSSLSSTSTSQVTLPINYHCDDPQNEEYGSVAKTTSSTGYEPNVIDNFDYCETCTAIFQNDPVDVDTEPSYSFDAELDDETIGKALSSPLFTQEREESANRRQAYHSHEESLIPAQSFFTRTSTGRPVFEQSSKIVSKTEVESRLGKRATQDSPWKTKKSKFLLKSELRSRSTNFKPILTEEVSRN